MLEQKLTRVALTFALLLRGSTQSFAQTSILIGTVSSDSAGKRPVVGAMVSMVTPSMTVRTDSTGTYRMNGLRPGFYVIMVRSIGFTPSYDTVTVLGEDATLLSVVMEQTITTLDPVVTKSRRVEYRSPLLRGFEDRRAEGFGEFVSETQLRDKENDRVSDVLTSHLPGIRVMRTKSGTIATSTRKAAMGSTCRATVYLDGVLISAANLDDFNVDQLAGVEWYAGEATAPPQFKHGGCGLLLLWTRER